MLDQHLFQKTLLTVSIILPSCLIILGIAILTLAHEDSETRRTTVEQCFTIFSLYLANLIPGYPNVFQGDLLSTGTVAVVPC